MANLRISTYPEDVLKQKAEPADPGEKGLKRLIDDMVETMYAASGVGLAAPQVGVSKRVIVLDTAFGEDEASELLVLINPEIVEAFGSMQNEEGCLSLPGFKAMVERAEEVTVRALDVEGREVEVLGEGLLSMALQHEIDHLEGTLLIDRISFLKREFFKKQIRKSLAKTG